MPAGLLKLSCILVVMAVVSSFDVVYSPHPSLFFDCWDVPSLQLKARTTHRAIAARIVGAMETVKSSPEDYLPPQSHKEFASRSVNKI